MAQIIFRRTRSSWQSSSPTSTKIQRNRREHSYCLPTSGGQLTINVAELLLKWELTTFRRCKNDISSEETRLSHNRHYSCYKTMSGFVQLPQLRKELNRCRGLHWNTHPTGWVLTMWQLKISYIISVWRKINLKLNL